MARNTKRTPVLEEAILRALRAGSTRAAAAEYVGVDRTQLWRWMRDDAAFRNECLRAEAEAEIAYTGILRKAATDDWRAAFAWLERRRSEDWGRKDRINIVHIIRQMAEEQGLSTQETAEALAEAERYLRELRGAGAR